MNKSDQDQDNFKFTERWIEQHLPFGLEQTTDVLYNDFFKALFKSNSRDSPSPSAFRGRLSQIESISSRYVWVERNKKRIRMKAWYKKHYYIDPLPDVPCKWAKMHDKMVAFMNQPYFINLRRK